MTSLKEQARNRFLCMLTLPQLREAPNMLKTRRDTARRTRERLRPTVLRVVMCWENLSTVRQGL